MITNIVSKDVNSCKIKRLYEISNCLSNLLKKSSNCNDASPVIDDLNEVIRAVKEQFKAYCQKILELDKEVKVLESQKKAFEKNSLTQLEENNELKKKLLDVQESCKEEIRQIKCTNKKLKSGLDDLEFVYSHTLREVKDLEKKSLEKNNKILELTRNKAVILNTDGKKNTISASYPVLEVTKPLNGRVQLRDKLWESRAQANDIKVVNMVEIMERKCSSLMEELRRLKLDNKRQNELITSLKRQVTQKDEELDRLQKKLEKDESVGTVNSDYCCHCEQLKCKVGKLELQLTETIEKQHEAMTRAVQLAERNRNLERELKDIDQMAMAVEEECQNKVKQNARNVTVLQEKISEKMDEIKSLQGEVMDLKIRLDKEKLMVEKLNMEKKALERSLEDALAEKKCLNDKINHCIMIERNLRIETAKLQEVNKSLQRQLNEIEGKLGDTLGKMSKGKEKVKPKKKNPALGLPISSSQGSNHCRLGTQKTTMKTDSKLENQSDIPEFDHINADRDRIHRDVHCLCFKECHRLGDSDSCHWDHHSLPVNYHRKLSELEQEIEMLRQENMCLKRGKSLRSKLDEDCTFCPSGDSFKIMLDRLERERDMALSDVSKLQTERDILRERIKLSTESQIGENSRMERILLDNEERIRRLESERRELITSQGSQRATLSALEEKCDDYKNQLLNVQNELSRMTTHYNQLKVLQEETDRSLAEVHGRLSHSQTELNLTVNKLKELENVNRGLEDQITLLKKEKATLKTNLACNEREKDELVITLDQKTELCSKQQGEIKNRDKYIAELNEKISELQKKFDLILNEKTSRDHAVLNYEHEVKHLRDELEKCENQREAFKRENRRLQDDLTSAVKDCHLARRQLETEKKEVENLKRQLQQYVNEVKRAEELLFQKESERNEMLDHFRSLSIEATALETNNHTLESAVETTKVELVAANNRLTDLEREVATKETLVNSYETQIVDLTARVAELESKLKQESEERYRVEEDLAALRDLCSTIDDQKEKLRRQASDADAEKLHLMNEVQRLNEEYEGLNHKLTHERTLAQTLEKSLSHSRQETLEHKITNKDLQAQVQQLRLNIEELTEKLENESQNVQKYQSQCADLSCQVSELRREVTNARFEKARALDVNRRGILDGTCGRKMEDVELEEEEETSFRNIPPLVFLEDSDRTVSHSDDEVNFSGPMGNDRPRIKFLSPVLEKADGRSREGTSSELSSMPEEYPSGKVLGSSWDDQSRFRWNADHEDIRRVDPEDADRQFGFDRLSDVSSVDQTTYPCVGSRLMNPKVLTETRLCGCPSTDNTRVGLYPCSFESKHEFDLNRLRLYSESVGTACHRNYQEDQIVCSLNGRDGSIDLYT